MRVTIKTKLAVSFGIIILMLCGAGYLAITSLAQTNASMQEFVRLPFTQVQQLDEIKFITTENSQVANRVLFTSSDSGKAALRKEFNDNEKQFETVFNEYSALLPDDRRADATGLKDAWNDYVKASEAAMDMSQQNNQNKAIDLEHASAVPLGKDLDKALNALAAKLPPGPDSADLTARLANIRMNLLDMRGLTWEIIADTDEATAKDLDANFNALLTSAGASISSLPSAKGDIATEAAAVNSAWQSFATVMKQVGPRSEPRTPTAGRLPSSRGRCLRPRRLS